jgi:1,4-dihydroxy-2-naphthoyl-CoA hydrolase
VDSGPEGWTEGRRAGQAGAVTNPDELLALMPFAAEVGVRLDAAGPERAVGHLEWAAQRCTAGGVLHGGALMSLADSVGAICAYLNLPAGAGTATTNSTTTLLRAVRGGTVTATARPLHRGRTLIVVQTDLTDGDGHLVAQTTQSQAVLPGA